MAFMAFMAFIKVKVIILVENYVKTCSTLQYIRFSQNSPFFKPKNYGLWPLEGQK